MDRVQTLENRMIIAQAGDLSYDCSYKYYGTTGFDEEEIR